MSGADKPPIGTWIRRCILGTHHSSVPADFVEAFKIPQVTWHLNFFLTRKVSAAEVRSLLYTHHVAFFNIMQRGIHGDRQPGDWENCPPSDFYEAAGRHWWSANSKPGSPYRTEEPDHREAYS